MYLQDFVLMRSLFNAFVAVFIANDYHSLFNENKYHSSVNSTITRNVMHH